MTTFDLQLLGVPTVARIEEDGGGVDLVWRLRRCVEILAFLALSPGFRAPRDHLAEAVWPGAERIVVERNLHPTISDLRRGLGRREALQLQQGIYSLSPEVRWAIDTERFRQIVREGRSANSDEAAILHYEDAWRLYRGPFLAGWDSEWIGEQRELLHRERADLLIELAEAYLRSNRDRDALDAYRSVLLDEPYDESLHVAVMKIYARQKRRDLVRRQYLKLRDELNELGVEPLPETEELFHRLMR